MRTSYMDICDKWYLTVKNKGLDFSFGVNLDMNDPRHKEIYSFVIDEANKLLKENDGNPNE